MALDTTRIAQTIDVERLSRSRVAIIGVGGAANLVASLVRCGLGAVTLIDPDTVSRFQRAGSRVIGTATTVAEARAWEDVGADAVCVWVEADWAPGLTLDGEPLPIVGAESEVMLF